MAIKNKTRYALLGVLSLMSGSGYDIKKFCDKSIAHFWNENYGHIYPVLGQLEKEGLIQKSEKEEEERRKVYSITAKGMEEFCEWLLQPVEYQPARSELLLKIAFANHIPREKTIAMLQEVKEKKKQKLAEYLEIELSYVSDEKVRENEGFPYWLAPLRYGILATRASIEWCEETIFNIGQYGERTEKGLEG